MRPLHLFEKSRAMPIGMTVIYAWFERTQTLCKPPTIWGVIIWAHNQKELTGIRLRCPRDYR